MAKLTGDYARSLFGAARREGRLEELYRGALSYSYKEEHEGLPEEFRSLATSLPREQVAPIIGRFLELAKLEMQIVDVEVISAMPLTDEQLGKLEHHIIMLVKKRLHIKTVVDPFILGGIRVIIGNHVVDSSIKGQMDKIKDSLYREVFSQHEENPL